MRVRPSLLSYITIPPVVSAELDMLFHTPRTLELPAVDMTDRRRILVYSLAYPAADASIKSESISSKAF